MAPTLMRRMVIIIGLWGDQAVAFWWHWFFPFQVMNDPEFLQSVLQVGKIVFVNVTAYSLSYWCLISNWLEPAWRGPRLWGSAGGHGRHEGASASDLRTHFLLLLMNCWCGCIFYAICIIVSVQFFFPRSLDILINLVTKKSKKRIL